MNLSHPHSSQPQRPETDRAPVRRIAVILNPTAGRGQARLRRSALEALLQRSVDSLPLLAEGDSVRWQILETAAPGGGTPLARQAVAEGADIVAAAGGDGTCGEVVNGLVGSSALLGILPLGTGNDFARCIGLGTDLNQAVRTLFHGRISPLDLGRVQDRWFLNIAGCGFDAVVAERVNLGFHMLRGTAAYLAAITWSLAHFHPAKMILTLDGEERRMRAMLCSVCNAQSYGGGLRIAPDARIDDGLFDVCVLEDVGRLQFLRAFPRVFRGTHTTHPRFSMQRARCVRVESDPPLPVLIDGDVRGTTPVTFTLHPRALRVLTPTC